MSLSDGFRRRWVQFQVRRSSTVGGDSTRVVVAEQFDIGCSAERAIAFVGDVASVPLMTRTQPMVAFTVPGTPAGQPGERQVVVRLRADGAMIGTLREVVELVPGRRLVTRELSGEPQMVRTFTAEPLGESACRLRYERAIDAPRRELRLVRAQAPSAVRYTLALVAHHAGGAPLREPEPESRELRRHREQLEQQTWAHAQMPLSQSTVHSSADVAAVADRVWEAILDVGNDRLASADPDAVSFTVPGTPSGAIGELRCVVRHLSHRALVGSFAETVAVEPGRALVLRNRSTSHSTSTTFTVVPTTAGTRVDARMEVEDHDASGRSRSSYREILDAYLTGIRRLVEA